MKYKVEGRKVYNIIYIIVTITILFSNFFSSQLEILLRLTPNYKFSDDTELHFIDVGQGDAIAVKFDNGKTMLVDTGISEYKSKLTNYLDNIILNNSKEIDILLLTHIDTDHSGNIEYLLKNYTIHSIYLPPMSVFSEADNKYKYCNSLIDLSRDKNIEINYNEEGIQLNIGKTKLTWLSPIDIETKSDVSNNDYSPVIKIEYNGCSALLTGDISDKVEVELLNYYPTEFLDVDIIKLAHHGSAYSNTFEFLVATSPKYAAISVGKNTYGHPANKTIERIMEYDKEYNENLYSNTYITKEDGNIIFTLRTNVKVNTIDNIDNYSFVSYYVYSSISILFLLFFMLVPYYKVLRKNIRFIKQNKDFKKLKEQKKKTPLKIQENNKTWFFVKFI